MNTVFHKIISGEIASQRVYEDELCIVINDINPVAPVHLLCIPKQYIPDLSQSNLDHQLLLGHLLLVVKQVASDKGIDGSGYRVIINCGSDSGMEVPYLHIHLIGGKKLSNIG